MESTETIQVLGRLPALLRYWRWRYGLSGTLPGLALAALGLAPKLSQTLPLTLTLIGAALALAGLGLGWRYAGLRFANYRAELHQAEGDAELHEAKGVVLFSGVWWRSEVWVPMARLQHLDVSQGPLDRRWGMATLSLHTAGSHDQHISIVGLPLAEAHGLRERLLPRQALPHE